MQHTQRLLAWLLAVLLTALPMAPLQAAMIGTDRIVNPAQYGHAATPLQQFLGRETARQQLEALGVSPDLVQERISRLSDAELARINRDIGQLNAGGDVLEILLIIFIVFVITDVIGATDIFPFIHPVN
jgi:hypothetical protein